MNTSNADKRTYKHELANYAVGLLFALVLTAVPFAVVAWKLMPVIWALATVLVLGLIQIAVHLRCFLHISLSRSSRDDLNLLLFSGLIVLLMVGGTLIIMFNLHQRMH